MTDSNPASASQPYPQVWLLLGHKAGDNTQVLALANALGWRQEKKHMVYRHHELLTNRLLGITLHGIDRDQSSALEPPWPALVISAGRRNEPVARWIKKRSGNITKLVHIGRPWAPLDAFDLVVTTPQYQLPARPNVLHNELPLHDMTQDALAQAAKHWSSRLAQLRQPRIAVLIGGDSGPFVFTAEKGSRLGRLSNRLAATRQGSLLVTTSARTPPAAFQAFRKEIRVPAYIFRWTADADNPYRAYLALGDEFVVTGESMSMLGEASATQKPLYIFDPGDPAGERWWRYRHNFRYKPLTHRLGMYLGPRRMLRDVGRIQKRLIQTGRAVWLGEEFPAGKKLPPADDLERATARVRALFE